ncbi:MAG: WbqC family protein [Bacteroidota bacterium]
MILTAHQPVYIPWLGLFHKMYLADQFCIFDIAQYQSRDYNNRNKIKTNTGPIWLSVPVESRNHFEKKICDVRIVQDGWNKKHFKSISLAYKKATFYDRYMEGLEKIYHQTSYTFLTDLNTDMLHFFLESLGIQIPTVKASDYEFVGTKSDLVLDMCKKLGAKTYIFGALGRDYADVASFVNAGIRPLFQDYRHPTYRQLHGEFIPCMSVLDLLFNEGPDSLRILVSGNTSKQDLLSDSAVMK